MKTKVHEKNGITFQYNALTKKWEFKVNETFSYLSTLKGLVMATKVASIIAGSVKRCGTIDGMARANISRIGA